jgi:hypothetical protein
MMLPALIVAVFALSIQAADYLTPEGKLKERIEVRDLQGGFAGFTGKYYAIETDGAWVAGDVGPNEKLGPPATKGKATPEQLAALAKALGQHDLAALASHGETETNPKVVKITFGKKTMELQPKPGKADATADKAVRVRYQGIVDAVKALCRP